MASPCYWILGQLTDERFDSGRGYDNVNQTSAAVKGMRKANIPLETMWNDMCVLPYSPHSAHPLTSLPAPSDYMRAYQVRSKTDLTESDS